MAKIDPRVAAYLAYFGQLQGWIIKGITVDPSDPSIGPVWGLRLAHPDRPERKIAWILCDPEGNGPGHLDIVDEEG